MERLGEDVRRELGRFGPQAALGKLVERWPAAVGEEIARNAWPARIARDGTLHVHTSSSTWAFELAQLESEVRARLGELAPPKLRFLPGPLPEPAPPPSETTQQAVVPTSGDVAEAAELASEIGDENLRELVARAAAASVAKARISRNL